MTSADIVIIGTGAGGGTLARALKGSGARVLILERGDFLPSEPENWSPQAVFAENRYKTTELWEDSRGRPFHPGIHYWVGGNTKVYGAVLHRLRAEDFDAIEHEGGTSPAWPIGYADLEPYYRVAEEWYLAHGEAGIDPTEPWRSSPYPYPSDSARSVHVRACRPHAPARVCTHIRCRLVWITGREAAASDAEPATLFPVRSGPKGMLTPAAFFRRCRIPESSFGRMPWPLDC